MEVEPCALLNAESARPTRSLIVLGASGSVGTTALDFLRASADSPNGDIALAGVSVHSSTDRLREILREFPAAKLAAVSSEAAYDRDIDSLRTEFPGVTFFRGDDGLVEMIPAGQANGADTVLTAVVGACGIRATMECLRLNLKTALANKETLVTAGPAIDAYLRGLISSGVKERPVILPVDSEHNAIFQVLEGVKPSHIDKIILTASGGPFRDTAAADLKNVSREQVLNHPTWKMGPKITVDSAGMINKGLEIIEAHYLFSLGYESIDVLIHRHSLVHGMLATRDGGYLLCASQPNMVFPTAHALLYPETVPRPHSMATPPQAWPGLEFETVAADKYPGYYLCRRAGEAGGTMPAILNAANEIAVEKFLAGAIHFTDIPRVLETVLDRSENESGTELELFLQADERARALASESAAAIG